MAVIFIEGQSIIGFNQSLYFIQETSGAQMSNDLTGLAAGTYSVLAYDIEMNGTITSDTVADQQSVNITSGSSTTTSE